MRVTDESSEFVQRVAAQTTHLDQITINDFFPDISATFARKLSPFLA